MSDLPDTTAASNGSLSWKPPSSALEWSSGLWKAKAVSAVSYPEEGNDACFQVEDSSYWFNHRNECIQEIIRQFPPAGMLYDIGGGNGFVACKLQQAGVPVALVEPGSGALNAVRRGVDHVIWAALEDAGLAEKSLPAAGVFDVVEHIEHDAAFLEGIRRLLAPGGRLYCTVPAFSSLWSDEDVYAGHYRRYTLDTLQSVFEAAGFEVEFASCFFAWLTFPVFALRRVPFLIRGCKDNASKTDSMKSDHSLPAVLQSPVKMANAWELSLLRSRRVIPFGTSLICVARSP